jgi:quinol monooxygenase YgiN
MSSLLAKIQIHSGKEAEFEDVMAYMYRQTHGSEEGVLRYEYWRGREPGFYYCLLSFRDAVTFWRHQASDHHDAAFCGVYRGARPGGHRPGATGLTTAAHIRRSVTAGRVAGGAGAGTTLPDYRSALVAGPALLARPVDLDAVI